VLPIEIALTAPPTNPVMIVLNRVLAAAAHVLPTLFGYQLLFVARTAR
jgi:hypothetical protein